MPVISRFSGIIIKMYLRQSEHNPPHIHAICGRPKVSTHYHLKRRSDLCHIVFSMQL